MNILINSFACIFLFSITTYGSSKSYTNNKGATFLETREDKLKKQKRNASEISIEEPSTENTNLQQLKSQKLNTRNNTKTSSTNKESRNVNNETIDYIDKNIYSLLNDFKPQIHVPGFITSKPLAPLGRILGPVGKIKRSLNGDTIYFKWIASRQSPSIGDRFAVYDPAVVMQSKNSAKDYFIYANSWKRRSSLDKQKLVGYYYQIKAEVEITEVKPTLITAKIIWSSGKLDVQQELIRSPPVYESISPITGGQPIHATIISGFPTETILPKRGSIIYLNKGAVDGVKIGRIFEPWENIRLTENVEDQPTNTLGKAMIIYVSDHYSTAMIVDQFNIIAIGSNVRAVTSGVDKQENYKLLQNYQNYSNRVTPSKLDGIEIKMGDLSLTPAERRRLEQLHREEVLKRQSGNSDVNEFQPAGDNASQSTGSFDTPDFFNAEQKQKPKKKKPATDEQRLNNIMQLN